MTETKSLAAHWDAFFAKTEEDNLNQLVKEGGYAPFAEFSKTGVNRCAGLPVKQYDSEDLKQRLPGFQLLASEAFTYYNPGGDPKPYLYSLLQRSGAR